FQVLFLFAQTLLQDADLGGGTLVLNGNGQLRGDLVEQRQVLGLKRISAGAAKDENAQRSRRPQKWDTTEGSHALRQKPPCNLGVKALQLFLGEDHGGTRFQGAAAG